ncbi:uncharacterized protein BCR38DRAFT_490845 [Pseudomassariella vexata]|uniref:RRM domain-containing protein n=1 Tax=Pseudomassariella vexata TaxID=1141098 RepID=A0A1Y2D9A1_9PEZI|nr:uncharacterized protein BCR38DRAFT_490845 [Pseudomassariella vexata]ORY55841.1 hypothetical protein BCR38DRAFT_490845 [Pseudomassariella vexata]
MWYVRRILDVFGSGKSSNTEVTSTKTDATSTNIQDVQKGPDSVELQSLPPPFTPLAFGLPPPHKIRMTGHERIVWATYERHLITARTVHVSGVWNDVTNHAIYELFRPCGKIIHFDVLYTQNESKIARLVFEDRDAIRKALLLNKTQQLGGVITVTRAGPETVPSDQTHVPDFSIAWDMGEWQKFCEDQCPDLTPFRRCHTT